MVGGEASNAISKLSAGQETKHRWVGHSAETLGANLEEEMANKLYMAAEHVRKYSNSKTKNKK